ncbi:hypothetical protein PF007_g33063, partial [Phytophthora fragariae]
MRRVDLKTTSQTKLGPSLSESPLFSATQLKRRVWCLQPQKPQQLPPSQQQQQRQATMAKLAASPAKMLK